MNKKNIILGSAFNPIHHGHVYIAKMALELFAPERIFFVPTKISPHKSSSDLIAATHRLNMLKLELENHKKLKDISIIETCEIDRPGVSYSIDTLNFLIKKYNINEKPVFIIGDDLIPTLPNWKDIDNLKNLVDFCVFNRNSDLKFCENDLKYIDYKMKNKPLEISSSAIRQEIKANKTGIEENKISPEGLSPNVLEYIKINKLYM